MNGLKTAILYSLKPHELGFCGPQGDDKSKCVLREYLLGKKYPRTEIVELLNKFHGSSSYYSLIARLNNIDNRYDRRVVEAYWLGNELLDRVKASDIRSMILKEFTKKGFLAKARAQKIVDSIPPEVVPHHSFHVFGVGSITNRVKITPKLKDECKVSWGEVREILDKRGEVIVSMQKLFPLKKAEKKVSRDKQIFPELKKGDWISFHWGMAIERLTKEELKNLIKYTNINYKALETVEKATF